MCGANLLSRKKELEDWAFGLTFSVLFFIDLECTIEIAVRRFLWKPTQFPALVRTITDGLCCL